MNMMNATTGCLLWLLATTAEALTIKQCRLDAATELEQAYCEILAKGQSLPDFYDFQRNPANTQWLLLRSAAKRAGVELPAVDKAATALTTSATAPAFANQPRSAAPSTRAAQPRRPREATQSPEALDQCRVTQREIACNDRRYYLAINVPVKRLNPRVLTVDNRLQFAPPAADQTSIQYLSNLYPYYIEKMLLIGLGDSTVSFTKFAAIYEQSAAQEENFGQRFSEMYELLKQERRTMAVKTRYRDNYPQSIDNCMQLNSDLIACDNIEQNWIYQKLKHL